MRGEGQLGEKGARRPCYGKVFWGNQIKGKKGRTQRPLKAADSSLDMCLKRDAAADAKKGGKDRGETERVERD